MRATEVNPMRSTSVVVGRHDGRPEIKIDPLRISPYRNKQSLLTFPTLLRLLAFAATLAAIIHGLGQLIAYVVTIAGRFLGA